MLWKATWRSVALWIRFKLGARGFQKSGTSLAEDFLGASDFWYLSRVLWLSMHLLMLIGGQWPVRLYLDEMIKSIGGQWLSCDLGSATSLAEDLLGASDFLHLSRDLRPLLHWPV